MLGNIKSSIGRAFSYVVSSVERGISQIASVTQNIAEAFDYDYGTIRTYQEVVETAKDTWTKLNELPDFYRITDKFALTTEFDYRYKHIMTMQVHAYDKNTQQMVDQWITIESDTSHTKQEWFELATEAVIDTPFGTDLVLEYASEFQYYVRG